MFSIFKKILKPKQKEFYSIPKNYKFENVIEFTKPDINIFDKLIDQLTLLSQQKTMLVIESSLKEKTAVEYSTVQDLADEIKKDLEINFSDYSSEMQNEQIGFVYYLGTRILFSNSVEIVQKIYNKENDKIGNLYFALVVKYFNGKYYYWKW